jgi:hypothetical protein
MMTGKVTTWAMGCPLNLRDLARRVLENKAVVMGMDGKRERDERGANLAWLGFALFKFFLFQFLIA